MTNRAVQTYCHTSGSMRTVRLQPRVGYQRRVKIHKTNPLRTNQYTCKRSCKAIRTVRAQPRISHQASGKTRIIGLVENSIRPPGSMKSCIISPLKANENTRRGEPLTRRAMLVAMLLQKGVSPHWTLRLLWEPSGSMAILRMSSLPPTDARQSGRGTVAVECLFQKWRHLPR